MFRPSLRAFELPVCRRTSVVSLPKGSLPFWTDSAGELPMIRPCRLIKEEEMADNSKFQRLLEPHHIGAVKTKNRIIKTASGMLMWHEDDLNVNERVKAYYESIARGGVGLLIVESATIDYPFGRRWKERYRIDDDKYIKGLSELTKIIHNYGCPTFIELVHEGPWQTKLPFLTEPLFEGPPIGASPISLMNPNDFHADVPRPLTVAEIEELVDKFASAAERCAKAGFDGVDINAASTHLLHNFLSPSGTAGRMLMVVARKIGCGLLGRLFRRSRNALERTLR